MEIGIDFAWIGAWSRAELINVTGFVNPTLSSCGLKFKTPSSTAITKMPKRGANCYKESISYSLKRAERTNDKRRAVVRKVGWSLQTTREIYAPNLCNRTVQVTLAVFHYLVTKGRDHRIVTPIYDDRSYQYNRKWKRERCGFCDGKFRLWILFLKARLCARIAASAN